MRKITQIRCACCGGNNGAIVYEGLTSVYSENPWSIAECTICKNIVTLPVPTAELLNEIYTRTYLYNVHRLALSEKKFRARSMANFIRKNFSGKEKKLFEAGCMYGYLMDELKTDFNTKGIEIGEEAVQYCKSKGLDVEDSSIEKFLSENSETYDIIVLSHVFEHLISPSQILNQLGERLNEDGKIILSIPNSVSFCRKVFGKNWGWWQVPVHINHFCLTALEKIAAMNKMKIDYVRFKGGDSLMLLLNLINLFGFKNKNKKPGLFQKWIINFFTTFFRYWYYLSNEELTVVIIKQ
jgi:2-polyprenyl-3-methyl-5-hydroxy-6-metoxy-1,4-benzoquinol methylase